MKVILVKLSNDDGTIVTNIFFQPVDGKHLIPPRNMGPIRFMEGKLRKKNNTSKEKDHMNYMLEKRDYSLESCREGICFITFKRKYDSRKDQLLL
mmetsp:Transcript_18856/g.24721  ORF Transcript_18856/g.24721 Transcript_18856/m.24721 type:complete len:95 (-) Transcript_18856:62-346(-)